MSTSTTVPNQVPEPSLRLSDILDEEYNYIHGLTEKETGVSFELINFDKLLAKLADEQSYIRSTNSTEKNPVQDNWRSRPTNEQPIRCETPYSRFAVWLHEVPDRPLATEELVKQVLKGKATDPDLLVKEPWLMDVATRPYTRGLLKRYLERKAVKPANQPVAEISELNQLLLEDAFPDYIQPKDNTVLKRIFRKMLTSHQTALCLSGGGIRSATFALGLIQGLAQHNLLGRFSYLSTVSGGGYTGGWLSAWIHQAGIDQVTDKLKTNSNIPINTEADPIHHLRQFSNYLSPQLGLLSTDTWTLVATYFRNLLLIWLVILPFLAALAATPLVAISLASYTVDFSQPLSFWLIGFLLVLISGLTISAIRFVHAYIPAPEHFSDVQKTITDRPLQSAKDQAAFINYCLLPFSAAVLLLILVWKWFGTLNPNVPHWATEIHQSLFHDQVAGLTIWSKGGLYIMAGTAFTHIAGWLLARPSPKKTLLQLLMFLVITFIGGFAGFLLLLTAKLLHHSSINVYTCLGFPCFLLAIILTGYVFEGMISRFVADSRREWTARYNAWLLVVGLGWLFMTSIVLLGPALIANLKLQIAGLGLSSGVLTALLGSSTKTAGPGQGAGSRHGKGADTSLVGRLSAYSLPIAATLTLLILLVLLSLFDRLLVSLLADQLTAWFGATTLTRTLEAIAPLVVLVILFVIGYALASAIDTNRFSLHAMYRARLIRAYLGASRPQSVRQPDPFTGFDEGDNLPMGDLHRETGSAADGLTAKPEQKPPFHLINLALNLVSGQNLAWQERKAEAFSVSLLHAGAMGLGYRRTYPHKQKPNGLLSDTDAPGQDDGPYCYGGDRGITLGTAMTISGAAASPNMGYHSSPLIAFLMTMFNVRLGCWLGNPGPTGDRTFYQSKPALAVKPIWDELLGKTDDMNEYVYLSDGGHFENLGLYEMVLRRNRFIVVSDASCDEHCTLEDLGNAIRKIRIDLGIPIEFDPPFNVHSRSHKLPVGDGQYWALGRIRYSAVDSVPDREAANVDGVLLYIKPGIYGAEPRDVFNYAATQAAFPHESTADQFFSESQFESYRILGRYVAETIVQTFPKQAGIDLADLFNADGPQKLWRNGQP
ncbi:hypothetical protein [Fibrella arboris]|uniref:hypothetical protein n=1 Tax=Fibrella arboris TaxID=3242486 RepID=UPI003521DF93